jgi:hypothetical protein
MNKRTFFCIVNVDENIKLDKWKDPHYERYHISHHNERKWDFQQKNTLPSLKVKNNPLAVEIHVDSCGNSGQSETPQNKTVIGFEEAHWSPAESEVYFNSRENSNNLCKRVLREKKYPQILDSNAII